MQTKHDWKEKKDCKINKANETTGNSKNKEYDTMQIYVARTLHIRHRTPVDATWEWVWIRTRSGQPIFSTLTKTDRNSIQIH